MVADTSILTRSLDATTSGELNMKSYIKPFSIILKTITNKDVSLVHQRQPSTLKSAIALDDWIIFG